MARPKQTKVYSLFKKNNRPNWYVRFRNETTGDFNSTGYSTGTSDRADAEKIAMTWFVKGIDGKPSIKAQTIIDLINQAELTQKDFAMIAEALKNKGGLAAYVVKGSRKEITAKDYFLDFYSNDSKTRKLNDMSISANTSKTRTYHIKAYWLDFLGNKYLSEFTTEDLRNFKMQLLERNELSDIYKSSILKTGLITFRQAFKDGLIDSDITAGIKNIAAKARKKDILTMQQFDALFMSDWKSNKIKVGNYLAARTGMRVGEICGLQKEDLLQINGVNYIWVRHSYSKNEDGLHGTKTGAESKIPITDNKLFEALLHLANTNPYNNGFVFWSDRSDNGKAGGVSTHPITAKQFSVSLKEQLEACGFADSSKKITFHSWRHFHRTYMQVKGNATTLTLSHVTAHSVEMIENLYGEHVTEADIENYIDADKKTFEHSLGDYFNIGAGKETTKLGNAGTKMIECDSKTA